MKRKCVFGFILSELLYLVCCVAEKLVLKSNSGKKAYGYISVQSDIFFGHLIEDLMNHWCFGTFNF